MDGALPLRRRLEGISGRAYEHPADRAATTALRAIPGLDQVLRLLSEYQTERSFRQFLLANAIRIGPEQLPHIWERHLRVLDTLDMPERYELYVSQTPEANAFTFGSAHPMIVLNSGLLSLLDDSEIEGVIAHEVGHILSDHLLYRTAITILLQISTRAIPGLAGLPLRAILLALLEWYRAAEYSADRASVLALRDPEILCSALMHTAGGRPAAGLNLNAFIQQATEYEEPDSEVQRGVRLFLQMNQSYPFAVQRVSELLRWVRSGEYDRIIRGEYRRRDEGEDMAEDVSEAASYYRSRFAAIFEESSSSAREVGESLTDWLRGRRLG